MAEIYLDNAATTPPSSPVIEAVNHALRTAWANPSSVHTKGLEAERVVADARRRVAAAVRARPDEIVFTSGGTEANALAVKGGARARAGRYRHIVTAMTEHPSVFNACEALEEEGFSVSYLPVDAQGRGERGRRAGCAAGRYRPGDVDVGQQRDGRGCIRSRTSPPPSRGNAPTFGFTWTGCRRWAKCRCG